MLKRYLKNYGFIGRDVLEHEVTDGNAEDSLYWISIDSLSAETIESIGKEFVEYNPKEAEQFAKYVLGMENEYPNIYDFVEGIIQENVLKLEKESYYWNHKFSQVMPRDILLDLGKYLSSKGITFTHKTDDGEYIEIPLSNNSTIEIYGFSYNDIVGESSDYYMNINGDELYVKESEILIQLERVDEHLLNKDKYTLENATYINHEKNWLLQETRIFDDENNGAMIESYLQVLDMTNNMVQVNDEMLNNDVWSVEWDKINSFTKKINKF